MKVLVTGISGTLGRLVTEELVRAGLRVCGIDRRAWEDVPADVCVHHVDLRGASVHDVFRQERPSIVVHLATTSPFAAGARRRLNLSLTRSLLDAVAKHGVSQLVFAGRHLYYGAAADLPLIRTEQDPPYGVETFPEAADVIAADMMACNALWGNPRTRTAVLRFSHCLGPNARGILAELLRGGRVPTILGFDPMVQFVDLEDIAVAIRLAVEHALSGVFNVGGAQPMPLGQAVLALGRTTVAIPEALYRLSLGRFGLPEIPAGALSLLKHPIIVDDTLFRSRTAYTQRFDERQTLERYRLANSEVDPPGSSPKQTS
jgi:UDP-glucose 4-epimerase